MINLIIVIGSIFVIWRFFIWYKKGFPVDYEKLHSANFYINIAGVIAAVLMIVIFGKENSNFSWIYIVIGIIGGTVIAIIEAFSYEKKNKLPNSDSRIHTKV
jgi:uncharacterized membrane protein YuzA (DUF378 family)